MIIEITPKDISNFVKKIEINPITNCWDWLGAKRSDNFGGYFFVNKHKVAPHKFVYQLVFGNYPFKSPVIRTCGNACCSNWEHMKAPVYDDGYSECNDCFEIVENALFASERGKCITCYHKYQNDFYTKNKNRVRRNMLKSKYDITNEQYENMLKEQNNVCAICLGKTVYNGKEIHLAIDHNHSTGRVRGLLCHKCNNALGLLKEDLKIIENMLCYINKYNQSTVLVD